MSDRMLDMIYAVRSDESTHRFVNHSLASLEPADVNPFAMGEPSMGVKGTKVGYAFLSLHCPSRERKNTS